MLDYAANGTEYRSMDRLRQAAAESAQKRGKSLDEEIKALLGGEGSEADSEAYWGQVEDNLRSRHVRLIFAKIADIPTFSHIPAEFASKWPSVSLADTFTNPQDLDKFKQTVEWFRSVAVKATSKGSTQPSMGPV